MTDPRQPTADLVTEAQRRHLAAGLGRVEQHLREIQALVGQPRTDRPPLLGQESRDLPADFGTTIQPAITSALADLSALVSTFALSPFHRSQFRAVQSLVMSSVVLVEDAGPRSLTAYGSIHPDLAPILDPLLARLRGQLLEIGRAVHAAAPGQDERI